MNPDPSDELSAILYTVGLIKGRWKLAILTQLSQQPIRYKDLWGSLHPVSEKILIEQLKALVEAGLVRRISYRQMPSRVEYGLTEWGESLKPILASMHAWGTAKQTMDRASKEPLNPVSDDLKSQ